jgi:DNA polymerase-3 subunit epsilon
MSLNFIAIDFETANENMNSICSLGIVVVRNGEIIEKKYRLIKPPDLRFNFHNTLIHGIGPVDVQNEKEFYVYWNSLKELIDNQTIVAHNAEFDIGVLKSALNTYQLEFPEILYTCSLRIAKRTWHHLESYSLGNLGQYFGYDFNHHHALEDAEMSARLIIDACKINNSSSLEELHDKLNITTGMLSWNKIHRKVKSEKVKKNKK